MDAGNDVVETELTTQDATATRIKGKEYPCIKCGATYVALSKKHTHCAECGVKRDKEVRGKLGIRPK